MALQPASRRTDCRTADQLCRKRHGRRLHAQSESRSGNQLGTRMRLRSLESRIVILFLVLILAVQLAGIFAIQTGIRENARASIREELSINQRVFRRLLDQYAQKLTQGARLLASDYGFKQAISSADRETIVSALAN